MRPKFRDKIVGPRFQRAPPLLFASKTEPACRRRGEHEILARPGVPPAGRPHAGSIRKVSEPRGLDRVAESPAGELPEQSGALLKGGGGKGEGKHSRMPRHGPVEEDVAAYDGSRRCNRVVRDCRQVGRRLARYARINSSASPVPGGSVGRRGSWLGGPTAVAAGPNSAAPPAGRPRGPCVGRHAEKKGVLQEARRH